MAVRLSKEQILANKQQLQLNGRPKRKRAPPTIRGYNFILQCWEEFLDRIDENPE